MDSALPSPEDILGALDKTGFILEHRVAQVLRNAKFDVRVNSAFPDSDTGKSREIDVVANVEREAKRLNLNVYVTADLIVECKNISNPLILIGDHGYYRERAFNDTISLSFDPLLLNFGKDYYSVETALKLASLPGSYSSEDFIAYQLLILDRHNGIWRASNSSVYDSIILPLFKAQQYRIGEITGENDEDEGNGDEWKYPSLNYIFPVVVTAGPVFTVDVSDELPAVRKVSWTRVTRNFNSVDIDADFQFDVVSFEKLSEYLDSRIIKIYNEAHDAILRNLHMFDPEWLSANLGEPKNKEYFSQWLSGYRELRDRNKATRPTT